MTIRGRLEDLQASEILQFLTQSGRSGTLRFYDDHKSKLLSFECGKLIFAVSQHKLPSLGEVLFQRGIIENQGHVDPREGVRWDEEVSRALEWRRLTGGPRVNGENSHARLGEILVRRGKITQQDLDLALEPESMPDSVLEEILIADGEISRVAIQGVRKIAAPEVSLYEALIGAKAVTREQIREAIAHMGEDTLADLLVYYGYVKKSEAHYTAEQLKALRGKARPIIRIGEFLVASGKVSQRQLEKALGAQLTNHLLLGEILVDQGVLTEDEIVAADREVDELRAAFSPLHALSEMLAEQHGFTSEDFQAAREAQLDRGETLASILVESGEVSEAELRQLFEDILKTEFCDLFLWQEGGYEFFEGFTLEDALAQGGLARLHDFEFEVGSILLEAHYRVDELHASKLRHICPETILRLAYPDGGGREDDLSPGERLLLERVDGKRPLEAVCSVLPGNSLAHRKLMLQIVERGFVCPLLRMEGYKKGQVARAADHDAQAVLFYEHALTAHGDQPTDSTLRAAAQDARVSVSRSVLRRISFNTAWALRCVRELPIFQVPLRLLSRIGFVARPARALHRGWVRMRALVAQRMARGSMAFEDFMIQKGLARQWWSFRRRLLDPFVRCLSAPVSRAMTMGLMVVAVSAILMVSGVPDAPDSPVDFDGGARPPLRTEDRPDDIRGAIAKLSVGGPVGPRPAVTEDAIYIVSRDGMLRRIALADPARFVWELEIGKFGDLLSDPTVHEETVFVASARGSIHAVSTDGQGVWTRKLSRIEPIAPLVCRGSDSTVGLVVVARESVYVLDARNGNTVYEMRTGNTIQARPWGSGDRIWVGGTDNHVYCADWQAQEIVWDTEVTDDVRSLSLGAGYLVARLRDSTLVALRAKDGAIEWQKTTDGKTIHRVAILDEGGLDAGRIVLERGGGALSFLGLQDGAYQSSMQAKDGLGVTRLAMVRDSVRDKYIYASRHGRVGALDSEGNHAWSGRENVGAVTGWVVAGEHLVVASVDGKLWFFSLGEAR